MKFTIRHWVIFWAPKHINMISTTLTLLLLSFCFSFKIHEQYKNFFHLFPQKKARKIDFVLLRIWEKVFLPFRWMSEWMADVNRDPSRFKLHIQSYCGVCLELQMLIRLISCEDNFFTVMSPIRERVNLCCFYKKKQGWQKIYFLSQWVSLLHFIYGVV